MKQSSFVLSLTVIGAGFLHAQITLNPVPSRAVGTPQLTVSNYNPNLVAGREFYAPQAIALDNSVSPPRLYVSDYVNNRVLAWKNAATFTTGQTADLAVGQPDLVTTFPEGPSAVASASGRVLISMPTTGLTRPSGIAVDKNGNLYVADGGNNRVLRYPTPFAQTGQYPVPDLVIGQAGFSGAGANYPGGTSTPTAQGMALTNGTTPLIATLTFDSSGNLWMTDPYNVRVLEFTASSLSGTGGGLTASLELGQPSLTSKYASALNPNVNTSFYNLSQFIAPVALGFDPSGNLFVGDFNRVLVFLGPSFSTDMSASSHILGVFPTTYTFPTGAALQMLIDQTVVYGPSAIFFPAGGVGVVDAAYNRIMIYPAFASWASDGTPPAATAILGQPNACTQWPNQTCKAANNGSLMGPSNSVFSAPAGAAYSGTDLFLADAGNNRVLDLPVNGAAIGPNATRVLGQDYFNTDAPNLIEGREFQFTGAANNSTLSDAGMAIDNSSGTPHLYVADPYNNRILGFKDLRTFQNGAANQADIVLGQKDFTTNLINYPSGSSNSPTSASLYRPVGLLVDANGNLYVADSLNGRVLRFPAPFAYAGSAPEPADLVLGQQNFTSTITDASTTNMAVPYGLAFTPSCNYLTPPCPAPNGLLVSDQYDNRVLYIPTNANGTFTGGADNDKPATIVFGQTGFNSIGAGNSLAGMSSPHHISCDTSGYVYVADTGNNRVLIFPDPHSASTPTDGESATVSITGLNAPESVFANPVTGEIWVANSGGGQSLRYASYQSVLLGLGSFSSIVESSGNFSYNPLNAIQDQYGDLFVADNAHRVALYFPGVNLCNGASFLPGSPTTAQYPSAGCLPNYDPTLKSALPTRALAPGTIATIFPCQNCAGAQFLNGQNPFTTFPMPTQLGGVEVLVNGVKAPLYYVGGPIPPGNPSGQINFVVPYETPPSGFADLEVIQISTGQILGATQMPMAAVSPGAFIEGGSGATVYAAAINQDTTINSASNPAPRGTVISLYMTGQGAVPGEPPDGMPVTSAPSAQYPATVYLNGIDVNSPNYGESNVQHVQFSGLNYYPGLWQINVLIPQTVVTTSGVWFAVVVDGEANWDVTSPFKTYIYVK